MHQLYPYLLLTHIVSALILFACEGVGIVATHLLAGGRDLETFRSVLSVTKRAASVGKVAPPLLLVTGLALAFTAWGGLRLAWVTLSLLLFILIALAVNLVDARILARLEARVAAADLGAAQALARSRGLSVSTALRLTALLALVFLMTLKPALAPALFGLLLIFSLGTLVALKPRASPYKVMQPRES